MILFFIFSQVLIRMYGLNIDLQSFKLNPNLIKENNKVRVSITTFPEENKQAVIIDAKKMNYIHHFFKENITNETKKIMFVFRKKSFINNDPIIASSMIDSKNLPLPCNKNNTEIKTIYLYEPLRNGNKNRRILGEMQVQFTLTEPFPVCSGRIDNNGNNFFEKLFKLQGYSKNNNEKDLISKIQNKDNPANLDDMCN